MMMTHQDIVVRTNLSVGRGGELMDRLDVPAGHRQDERYLRGSIELVVQHVPILLKEDEDDVNFLWCNVVAALDSLMNTGRGEFSYPSAPRTVEFRSVGGHQTLLLRDNKKAGVDQRVLATHLAEEAHAFFEQIESWGKRVHRCDPAFLQKVRQRAASY